MGFIQFQSNRTVNILKDAKCAEVNLDKKSNILIRTMVALILIPQGIRKQKQKCFRVISELHSHACANGQFLNYEANLGS